MNIHLSQGHVHYPNCDQIRGQWQGQLLLWSHADHSGYDLNLDLKQKRKILSNYTKLKIYCSKLEWYLCNFENGKKYIWLVLVVTEILRASKSSKIRTVLHTFWLTNFWLHFAADASEVSLKISSKKFVNLKYETMFLPWLPFKHKIIIFVENVHKSKYFKEQV